MSKVLRTATVRDGSIVTSKVAANAITFAKLQNIASGKILGRASNGTGIVEEIVCTSAGRAILSAANEAAQRAALGLGSAAVLNHGILAGNLVRLDDQARLPAIDGSLLTGIVAEQSYTHPNHTGDVTSAGDGATTIVANAITSPKIATGAVTSAKLASGAVGDATKITDNIITAAKIVNNAITFAKFQTIATSTLLGRTTGGTGNVETVALPLSPAYGGTGMTTFPVEIGISVSDETSNLTTGVSKILFRMPYAMTLTAVRANVRTAPVGSNIIVDINEGGVSILGTKLSIDATEKTSTTAASAATITDASLANDAEITIDIDQIGSATPGAGLKVWLIGKRP